MKKVFIIIVCLAILLPSLSFAKDLSGLYAARQQFRKDVQKYNSVDTLIYNTDDDLWITFQKKWRDIWRSNSISEDAYMVFLENFGRGVCRKFVDRFRLPFARVVVWAEKIGEGDHVESQCQ